MLLELYTQFIGEIQTKNLQNTSQVNYCCTKPVLLCTLILHVHYLK